MTDAHDPFGLAVLTQAHRVVLLAQAAGALSIGAPVPTEAASFLGQALIDWLERGGDLTRDHLRVAAVRGSHRTPHVIARALRVAGRQAEGAAHVTLRFPHRR